MILNADLIYYITLRFRLSYSRVEVILITILKSTSWNLDLDLSVGVICTTKT